MSVELYEYDLEVTDPRAQEWITDCEVSLVAHYDAARQHMAQMAIVSVSEPPLRRDILRSGFKAIVSHPVHALSAWNEIGRAQLDALMQESLRDSFTRVVTVDGVRAV